MLLNDKELSGPRYGMISPFISEQVRRLDYADDAKRVISFGLSSHGYDIRLAEHGFQIFSAVNAKAMEIDPKDFDENALIEPKLKQAQDGSWYYHLPPHHYGLGWSVERFRIMRDVLGICMGKSTYARAGVFINTTPLEAGWEGQLVVEIYNMTPLPVRLYVNEGIAQVIFLESKDQCLTSYADRNGKYQHQTKAVSKV